MIVDRPRFALVAALGLFCASPLYAQVALNVSLDSDDRLRGRSLSEGNPVATVGVGYDHPSGLYADAAAVAKLAGERPGLMRFQADLGYAVRLGSRLSLDVGVLRAQFTSRYAGERAAHYTELFAGLTRGRVSARAYYSPDYFRPGTSTLYGEVEAALIRSEKWHLSAHAGRLFYLTLAPAYANFRDQYDWRLSLARDVHGFELHAALTGGGPGTDFYSSGSHGRTAVVVGVSHVF